MQNNNLRPGWHQPPLASNPPKPPTPPSYTAIVSPPPTTKQATTPTGGPVPKKPFLKRLLPEWRLPGKRPLIILGAAGLVLIAGGGIGTYELVSHYSVPVIPSTKPKHKSVPKPTTVASLMTGLQVKPEVNKRPVTAVMIENSVAARPQSGLESAGVVFEAIAEGGITRFVALYQDTTSDYIGPVRSARPYYIEWLLGFDASYAHVGGSPNALQSINAWHVKDLNQFYNADYYHRIASRFAPHNVYTSTAELNTLEKSKGFTTSKYTSLPRKSVETPAKKRPKPTTTSIDMNFSGYEYNTHYAYNAKTNTYLRSEGGAPHTQVKKNGRLVQIAPKVLVSLIMPYGLEADGHHSTYKTIGSGKVYIFQNGTVQTGTWHKTSRTAQFTFTNAQGKPITLEPGQTWISALGSSSQVAYR